MNENVKKKSHLLQILKIYWNCDKYYLVTNNKTTQRISNPLFKKKMNRN